MRVERFKKMLGDNADVIPERLFENIREIHADGGIGSRVEVGFLVPNDAVDDIRLLKDLLNPLQVVTGDANDLIAQHSSLDNELLFTSFNPYWEDNVFICVTAYYLTGSFNEQ